MDAYDMIVTLLMETNKLLGGIVILVGFGVFLQIVQLGRGEFK